MKKIIAGMMLPVAVASTSLFVFASLSAASTQDTYTWARQVGLTTTSSVNEFRGSATISREEVAAILERAFQKNIFSGNISTTNSNTAYSDAAMIAPEFVNATQFVRNASLMKGNAGQFLPKYSLTNKEAFIILARSISSNPAGVTDASAVALAEKITGTTYTDSFLNTAATRENLFAWAQAFAGAQGTTATTTSGTTTSTNTNSNTTSSTVYATGQNIVLNNQTTTITKAGTYTVSGNIANGKLVVNVWEDEQVTIRLAWVNITNNSGEAIYIQSGKATIVLVDGTTNTITDAKTYTDTSDDAPNAAIYANEDLKITGNGKLTVNAQYNDGIATKDDLTIESGNITVTSADDAIRGKDSLVISGGTFTLTSGGDGLKSSNETKAEKGYVHITGGDFTISAGSDGIQGVTKVTIDGGNINIVTSTEGIEATQVYINGGNIRIYATDDGINASQNGLSDGTDMKIVITNGVLNISMAQGDTDAIDSNGDIIVSGGTINITAQSAFDFDGRATYTGGTITVNGQKITTITNSMMGGGFGGMGGMGGMPPVR